MIFKTRNYLPVVVCIFLASTASCGKDSPTEPVPQTPARVTLSSEEETLTAVGQTIQLTATVLDQENRVISGAVVTWTSTNPSVVKVDTNGLVTALTNGYVQIAASSGGLTASASIIVAQAPGRIEVMPSSSTLSALGETVQLTYTVYDGNDESIPGAGVSWSSDDDTVASVSANGLVTAVGNGTAQITATSGEVSETITVTVEIDYVGIERAILLEFYHATDGPNWTNSMNWMSETPVGEWYGIETDSEGRVQTINIVNNGLNGNIPRSIGELVRVDLLWLHDNELTGSIPSSIGNLTEMNNLDLSGNQLTDAIPSSLGNLVNCIELVLRNNQLTGNIPTSIGLMSNLGVLDLSDNQLTGDIPSALGQGRIAFFYLSNNRLSGSFPSFLGQHRWLQELYLNNNTAISGPLPLALSDTSQIPHLRELNISGTRLCAPLDPDFQTWLSGIFFSGSNCAL